MNSVATSEYTAVPYCLQGGGGPVAVLIRSVKVGHFIPAFSLDQAYQKWYG